MNQEPITIDESRRFMELEGTIERGQKTFVEVGLALAEIRDAKLYRSDYSTFEDYCREKWGWNASRARQLISAAEVQGSVTMVTLPNERCARALAKIPADQREEVLSKAAATGKITAKSISESAPRTSPEPEEAAPPAPSEEPPRVRTYDEELKEAFGGNVPPIDEPEPFRMPVLLEDLKAVYSYVTESTSDPKELKQAAIEIRILAKKLETMAKEIETMENA